VVELVGGYRRLPGPKPRLVLAGGDPDRGAYGRAAVQASAECPEVILSEIVTGTPKRELLTNALGVVSASSHEGLPIALLEAMSCARPCLVSDIPAHREVVESSGAALLVPMNTRWRSPPASKASAACGRASAWRWERPGVSGSPPPTTGTGRWTVSRPSTARSQGGPDAPEEHFVVARQPPRPRVDLEYASLEVLIDSRMPRRIRGLLP
jgi:hypothetical protein